jgi:hypothetical protein
MIQNLDTFKFILDSIYGQKIDSSRFRETHQHHKIGKSLEQFFDKKTAKRLALYAVKNDLQY